MARVHGKDLSTLTLASQSLLADTIALNFQSGSDTHDTTTLGDQWHEFTQGLKGGDEITHELFYENTNTTGTWAFITGKYTAGAAVALVIGDGTRTISVSVLVKGVSLPIKVDDMLKVTATYQLTGAVTFS